MPSIDILLPIALMLVAAKVVALASKAVGLPAVFGELMVGVILGPSVLGLLHQTDLLKVLADLGVIILMFIAGLETDLQMMKRVGTAASLAATFGVIVPFGLGLVAGLAFGLPFFESLFIGTALTATSVSISAETLQELGKLRTREGTTILGAAVIDDVLGVIVLAFVLSLNSNSSLWLPVLKMFVFFAVAGVVGLKVIPWLNNHLVRWHDHTEEAVLAVVISLVLVYAWAAEELGGVAAITGAYMMGVILSRLELKNRLEKSVRSIGYGFFIPIFFVGIGLQANLNGIVTDPGLVSLIAFIAVISKIGGCFVGAWLGRLKVKESFLVGVGMISRGEVALVIASIGLTQGIINSRIFSIIILMTVFTTVVTPLLLKLSYTWLERPAKVRVGAAKAEPAADGFDMAAD